MNAPPTLQPVLRRWYVVAFGLLATILAAVFMSGRLEPTYEATSSIVLLPGKQTIPAGSNPFLYLGGLTQARDVLVEAINADPRLAERTGEIPGSTAVAAADQTTSGPIVTLSASGSSAAATLRLLDAAEESLRLQLESLQDKAQTPEGARMSALVLSRDGVPDTNDRQAIRALIVIMILGLGVTMALTVLIDILLRTDLWQSRGAGSSRRNQRPIRTKRGAGGGEPPTEEDASPLQSPDRADALIPAAAEAGPPQT